MKLLQQRKNGSLWLHSITIRISLFNEELVGSPLGLSIPSFSRTIRQLKSHKMTPGANGCSDPHGAAPEQERGVARRAAQSWLACSTQGKMRYENSLLFRFLRGRTQSSNITQHSSSFCLMHSFFITFLGHLACARVRFLNTGPITLEETKSSKSRIYY